MVWHIRVWRRGKTNKVFYHTPQMPSGNNVLKSHSHNLQLLFFLKSMICFVCPDGLNGWNERAMMDLPSALAALRFLSSLMRGGLYWQCSTLCLATVCTRKSNICSPLQVETQNMRHLLFLLFNLYTVHFKIRDDTAQYREFRRLTCCLVLSPG